ncbi:long-chain-fatty-acid-CoA ligase [Armillaria mellea]|nr:long-chain-fatty-acid-CoA ligase [Armillaria mellea]
MTSAILWTPRCSVEEADKILTAPGGPFEIETRVSRQHFSAPAHGLNGIQVVDGRVLKVWKNLWPSIRAFFLHSSKEHAHKTCVVYEKERYTFQEMLDMAVKCAAIFRDVYGVKKGDRVVICSRNFPSYYVVFWACHILGAVTALMASIGTPQAHLGTFVLEDHEGKGHWEGMDVWSKVFPNYVKDPGEILRDDPRIIPEDNATIIFTSGTTGLPKGVFSTQRAFMSSLFNSASASGRDYIRRGVSVPSSPVSGTQVGVLLPTPLFHITGTSTTGGGNRIKRFDCRLCREEDVVSLAGVLSTITDLADSPLSGFPIEMITFGGAPVAPSLLRKSREAFPHASIGQAYGLTETNATSVGFYGPDYAAKPGSCGLVTSVNEILIMKDNVRAATGVVGEVWLHGPNMMKGYYGDQAATDKVLTKDGWVMTGDLGYVDEEGYVYIKDRIKDIIIRGRENIVSNLLDLLVTSQQCAGLCFHGERLVHRTAILEAAAVGVPDERLGELVTALVTVKPGYRGRINEKKLLATARKLLPKFAVPVMIVVKDGEFDHTPSSKIIKAQLRIMAREEWARRTKDGGTVGSAAKFKLMRMRRRVIQETEYPAGVRKAL